MSGRKEIFTDVIIVYDYAYVNGGAANVAIQTAIALSESYNVYYFAAVGPVCDELANSKVNVICLGGDDINTAGRAKAIVNGIWNRQARSRFGAFIKNFNPKTTVLHIHGWSKALSVSVIAEAEQQRFVPIITLHDYFCVCPNGGFYNFKSCKICDLHSMNLKCLFTNCDKRSYLQKLWRCARQLVQDRYVKNNADVVYLSISGLSENMVKRSVKSKKIIRVDNPVNLVERTAHFPCTNYRYLYVGRVSEEKGIELFCQAIEQLETSIPHIEGVVVGTGEKLAELKEQFTHIKFVGWKRPEEVREYMASARALVFTSKWPETFGLTVLEAMSAGIPCIVSDVAAVAEIITNKENGFIFKSGDLNELMECIVSVCDDEIWTGFHKAISDIFVSDYYSLRVYSQRLIQAYCIATEG